MYVYQGQYLFYPCFSVLGKCCVLPYKDYISSRPTEILEKDTFVVESKYMEVEKQVSP